MNVIGFDNEKYMREQSRNIRDRIAKFGGKLYLEFGGKLFDDYHASRVLPGFEPDSKVKMLLKMKDEAEIVIAISADDIERNKRRGDLGITYDEDTLRLIDAFRGIGLFVGSVVITHYRSQPAAELFQKRLETLGIKVYRHYIIPDYPSNVELIVSEDGFGKNDYIETERSLVVFGDHAQAGVYVVGRALTLAGRGEDNAALEMLGAVFDRFGSLDGRGDGGREGCE